MEPHCVIHGSKESFSTGIPRDSFDTKKVGRTAIIMYGERINQDTAVLTDERGECL